MNATETTTRTYFVESESMGRVFEVAADREMSDTEILDLYAQESGYVSWAVVEAEHMGEHPDRVSVRVE